MVVKWTPEIDQILLLKILEVHPELALNTSAIAGAWPTDKEAPTPRAISERLVRLRKITGVNFSVGGGKGRRTNAPSTPRRARNNTATNDDGSGSGGKRKRGGAKAAKGGADDDVDDGDDDEFTNVRVPAKEAAGLDDGYLAGFDEDVVVKQENGVVVLEDESEDDQRDDEVDMESPPKRFKVDVGEDEEEDEEINDGEQVNFFDSFENPDYDIAV
ncbi:MAG: hypothetical protein M1833_003339 [Piccolia ochrophora]|nr:MAG: hypothetical protein M1833_003339 [Piccolia ochrophora]